MPLEPASSSEQWSSGQVSPRLPRYVATGIPISTGMNDVPKYRLLPQSETLSQNTNLELAKMSREIASLTKLIQPLLPLLDAVQELERKNAELEKRNRILEWRFAQELQTMLDEPDNLDFLLNN